MPPKYFTGQRYPNSLQRTQNVTYLGYNNQYSSYIYSPIDMPNVQVTQRSYHVSVGQNAAYLRSIGFQELNGDTDFGGGRIGSIYRSDNKLVEIRGAFIRRTVLPPDENGIIQVMLEYMWSDSNNAMDHLLAYTTPSGSQLTFDIPLGAKPASNEQASPPSPPQQAPQQPPTPPQQAPTPPQQAPSQGNSWGSGFSTPPPRRDPNVLLNTLNALNARINESAVPTPTPAPDPSSGIAAMLARMSKLVFKDVSLTDGRFDVIGSTLWDNAPADNCVAWSLAVSLNVDISSVFQEFAKVNDVKESVESVCANAEFDAWIKLLRTSPADRAVHLYIDVMPEPVIFKGLFNDLPPAVIHVDTITRHARPVAPAQLQGFRRLLLDRFRTKPPSLANPLNIIVCTDDLLTIDFLTVHCKAKHSNRVFWYVKDSVAAIYDFMNENKITTLPGSYTAFSVLVDLDNGKQIKPVRIMVQLIDRDADDLNFIAGINEDIRIATSRYNEPAWQDARHASSSMTANSCMIWAHFRSHVARGGILVRGPEIENAVCEHSATTAIKIMGHKCPFGHHWIELDLCASYPSGMTSWLHTGMPRHHISNWTFTTDIALPPPSGKTLVSDASGLKITMTSALDNELVYLVRVTPADELTNLDVPVITLAMLQVLFVRGVSIMTHAQFEATLNMNHDLRNYCTIIATATLSRTRIANDGELSTLLREFLETSEQRSYEQQQADDKRVVARTAIERELNSLYAELEDIEPVTAYQVDQLYESLEQYLSEIGIVMTDDLDIMTALSDLSKTMHIALARYESMLSKNDAKIAALDAELVHLQTFKTKTKDEGLRTKVARKEELYRQELAALQAEKPAPMISLRIEQLHAQIDHVRAVSEYHSQIHFIEKRHINYADLCSMIDDIEAKLALLAETDEDRQRAAIKARNRVLRDRLVFLCGRTGSNRGTSESLITIDTDDVTVGVDTGPEVSAPPNNLLPLFSEIVTLQNMRLAQGIVTVFESTNQLPYFVHADALIYMEHDNRPWFNRAPPRGFQYKSSKRLPYDRVMINPFNVRYDIDKVRQTTPAIIMRLVSERRDPENAAAVTTEMATEALDLHSSLQVRGVYLTAAKNTVTAGCGKTFLAVHMAYEYCMRHGCTAALLAPTNVGVDRFRDDVKALDAADSMYPMTYDTFAGLVCGETRARNHIGHAVIVIDEVFLVNTKTLDILANLLLLTVPNLTIVLGSHMQIRARDSNIENVNTIIGLLTDNFTIELAIQKRYTDDEYARKLGIYEHDLHTNAQLYKRQFRASVAAAANGVTDTIPLHDMADIMVRAYTQQHQYFAAFIERKRVRNDTPVLVPDIFSDLGAIEWQYQLNRRTKWHDNPIIQRTCEFLEDTGGTIATKDTLNVTENALHLHNSHATRTARTRDAIMLAYKNATLLYAHSYRPELPLGSRPMYPRERLFATKNTTATKAGPAWDPATPNEYNSGPWRRIGSSKFRVSAATKFRITDIDASACTCRIPGDTSIESCDACYDNMRGVEVDEIVHLECQTNESVAEQITTVMWLVETHLDSCNNTTVDVSQGVTCKHDVVAYSGHSCRAASMTVAFSRASEARFNHLCLPST